MLRAAFFSAHLLFTIVCSSAAQEMRFDHISTDDGLSQDIVSNIIQDRQGFIWFGTEDGLNRYDGYGIHVYKHNPRDSHSLNGDWIKDLCVDRERRLWIVTNAGLNLYNPDSEQFIRIKHNLLSPSTPNNIGITSVCQDSSGTIWVVAEDGIHRLDERSNSLIEPPPNSIQFNSGIIIKFLFVDRHGTIWAVTTKGLYNVDTSHQTIIVNKKDVSDFSNTIGVSVNDIVEDHHGNLWIATADSGIIQFNAARRTRVQYKHQQDKSQSLSSNNVLALCIDAQGRLWSGTFEALDLYDSRTDGFVHYLPDSNDPSSLLGSRIYKIYTDRTGVLWVGTYRGGVNRFDPLKQRFIHYRHRQGVRGSLNHDEVYCIDGDRNGRIWIGTAAGLDKFDRDAQQYQHVIDVNKKFGGAVISGLCCRADGNIWVGTGRGNLHLVDSVGRMLRTFLTLPDEKSLLGERAIKALYETDDGILWIGTSQSGLMCLDTHDWKMTLQPLAKTGASFGLGVWVIHQDRKGNLWFGGWGGLSHLVRYNPRTGETHQYPAVPTDSVSFSIANARAIYEDSTGILWIGTWGGGLIRYNPVSGDYALITEQDGLSNNFVKGILGDGDNRLWVSTERGLTRYDPRTGSFTRYSKRDGLQGDRFFSGSCFKGKNGWMYFGGTNGLNMFHPDSIRDNPNIPPIAITSFKVFDKPFFHSQSMASVKEIHLTYDQNFFSFEFIALDYTAPQRNQYAYKLEGFDRNWVEAGTRRYAAYTRLSPGEYTFRVRGSNNDGVWNNEGATIKLIIAPPFWQTWWFIILSFAFVAAVLYAIYRYRIDQLLAIERLRARIASDLHDDVGTDLSSIVLATHAMEHKLALSPQQQDEIRQIGRIALRTQDMMRDIVWVLNSRNDSLSDIILKMREVNTRMLKGISFTFKGPDSPVTEKVSLEFKRTIFLFYKECLHNIIKHSAASEVSIEVRFQQGEFVLNLADNGKGFNPDAPNAGIGLQSMRSRAEHLGGSLTISSAEGSGTKITLTVKTT